MLTIQQSGFEKMFFFSAAQQPSVSLIANVFWKSFVPCPGQQEVRILDLSIHHPLYFMLLFLPLELFYFPSGHYQRVKS